MYLLKSSTDDISDALAVINSENELTLGFRDGRLVLAEVVDELRKIRLKEFGHVYAASKVGTYVEDFTLEVGKYVYCVERIGVNRPGFFLTTKDYGTKIMDAVDELGILREFKDNCKFPDDLVIRKYQIKQDLPTRKSTVGEIRSIIAPTDYKSGGGLQYEVHYNGNWTDEEMAKTSANAPTLYPTPTPFPNASADATFYAVFADYKEQ